MTIAAKNVEETNQQVSSNEWKSIGDATVKNQNKNSTTQNEPNN